MDDTISFFLTRAIDADGYQAQSDEPFPEQTRAKRRASRRDEVRRVLLISPEDYLGSLDDQLWA